MSRQSPLAIALQAPGQSLRWRAREFGCWSFIRANPWMLSHLLERRWIYGFVPRIFKSSKHEVSGVLLLVALTSSAEDSQA